MSNPDLVRSKALNNIPSRKLQEIVSSINNSDDPLEKKNVNSMIMNRFADSNIPIEYWNLKMSEFKGEPRLLTSYNEYTKDLKESYKLGTSICYAGSHGVGKTTVLTAILKKASIKGYDCLYTTLSDIVSVLTTGSSDDKYTARRELTLVDFLAIDEVDPRFMPSENAADLYARSLESVFRTRSQNKLPILMGTNSPNPVESFNGALKASISSLMNGYVKVFAIAPGKDFRKEKV